MARVPGISGYASEAPDLLRRYEEHGFEEVQKHLLPFLPATPGRAMDIGAGTGRDAAGLAQRGWDVVAVEPVAEMRAGAQKLHPEPNITWIDDGLPELAVVVALEKRFDLISMNAVLMHLDAETRRQALQTIAPLVAPEGLLSMSLRHGPVPEGRTMFDITSTEIRATCEPLGFSVLFDADMPSRDQAGISWTRMVLRRTWA